VSEAIDLHDFGGDGTYLEFVMGDCGLPTVPEVLLRLHDKAREHAAFPMYIMQPNSPDAQLHHFIRSIAKYLTESYGSPLYDNVAAVGNAIFGITTTTSDDVRSLLRVDRARAQKRKKDLMQRLLSGEDLPEEYRPVRRRIGRKSE
jgi:hypothetical protein